MPALEAAPTVTASTLPAARDTGIAVAAATTPSPSPVPAAGPGLPATNVAGELSGASVDALNFVPPAAGAAPFASAPSVLLTAPREPDVVPVELLAQSVSQSESLARLADGAPLPDTANALREARLNEAFDKVRDEVVLAQQAQAEVLASGAVLSSSVSVGYVLWLARGGALAASLLSALPAWSTIDPLPVLSQMKRREGGPNAAGATDDEDDETDPIEKLFGKARQLMGRGATAKTLRTEPATPADPAAPAPAPELPA